MEGSAPFIAKSGSKVGTMVSEDRGSGFATLIAILELEGVRNWVRDMSMAILVTCGRFLGVSDEGCHVTALGGWVNVHKCGPIRG